MKIKEHQSLAPLTTFHVGGPARYYAEVATLEELQEALNWGKEHSQKIFLLAGGSNVIVSSRGFAGLVINIQIDSHALAGHILTSGASTPMKILVDSSIAAGLAGLEWAGGLPGSFGGAIRGNAGCFGGEIKDVVLSVTSVDIKTGDRVTRNNFECQFNYRDSLFKRVEEVIVSAQLQLKPGDVDGLREIADDHIRYRQQRHPMDLPNAGSIFKNTPVTRVPTKQLPQFKDSIKTDPFPVVPTAKVIALAGLQELRVGDAQISEKHTNYIVNLGNATGEQIVELISQVRTAVKKKFEIELEIEPELVGF